MIPTSTRATRIPPALLCGGCVAFIVYGSLFPFQFRPTSQAFTAIFEDWEPFLNRSDAVDNILLFIPLGIAIRFAVGSQAGRWLAAAVAWVVLGFGLQVAQLYVPSRVASLADAINNAIGLIAGLLLARLLSRWLDRRRFAGRAGDRFALLLVGAWYAYESFPFVPTLDVGLLAAHIKPLIRAPDFEWLRLFRHALAAALGSIALLEARPLQRRGICLAVAATVLVLSEFLVAYGDLRLEALLGIALGLAIGVLCERGLGVHVRYAVLGLASVALLMTVLTPFRGLAPFSSFTLTPFSSLLWQGTVAGIPTVAFEALSIGSLIWAMSRMTRPTRRAWQVAAPLLLLMAGLEVLRRLSGNGPGDTGNLIVAALLLPFAMTWRTSGVGADRVTHPSEPTTSPPVAAAGKTTDRQSGRRRVAVQAVAMVAVLTAGLWFLLRLPSVPYNVRELFETRSAPTLAVFSLALLWLGAGPAWLIRSAARRPVSAAWLPVFIVATSLISLLLLRLSVTQESLDDITGSTDLYRRVVQEGLWGDAWRLRLAAMPSSLIGALERAVRYIALYSVLLIPLAAAWLFIERRWPFAQKLLAFPILAGCWWLAECVVVDWAITDNLVELIARGGIPYLALLMVVMAVHAATAAGRLHGTRAMVLAAFTIGALPLGWWLLKRGLEPVLMKYGQVFSAWQFLLGRDRTTLLSEGHLFGRWCLVYLSAVIVCALGLSLVRRWDAAIAPTR